MKPKFHILTIFVLIFTLSVCSSKTDSAPAEKVNEKALITFIELGSVRCIPCKQMQPVMASIEKKYEQQVEVVFYDVWEADQKDYALQYGIKLIPTQVFLDSTGTELMRHEGYLPEIEIDSFLVRHGLIPNRVSG